MDFDLEALTNVEQTFYDAGYADGHAHGRIHGLIEGRALGREKGYEMWEELAFYEGFARTWQGLYPRSDDRAANHIRHLLDLISQFPTVNPSAADSELDILKLSRQIQSRYRALCASLGVKPSLVRASRSDDAHSLPESGATPKNPLWTLEGQSF
ncbi:Yae1-N domain-containing protein [Mycena chlorophos]|uniref:Yae1-N domain-containing protein n=1 Tax=Mycena chlorophos TaxID=658473 RepID=A0A8H6TTT2_MYCCL|nr:Yae1-N domain-containing protein [Mycena chlorophos]